MNTSTSASSTMATNHFPEFRQSEYWLELRTRASEMDHRITKRLQKFEMDFLIGTQKKVHSAPWELAQHIRWAITELAQEKVKAISMEGLLHTHITLYVKFEDWHWRFEIYNLVFHYLKGRTLGWIYSLKIITQDSDGEIIEFKSVLTK